MGTLLVAGGAPMNNYKYNKIEQVVVDYVTINKILKKVKNWNIKYEKPKTNKQITSEIYIDDKPLNFTITGRFLDGCKKIKTYIFSKDGRPAEQEINPYEHYKELKKYVKVHDLIKENKLFDDFTSVPFIYFSPKVNHKELSNAISYDTNLTYFYLLSKSFPDTTRPLGKGIVKDGIVGFSLSEKNVVSKDGKIRTCLELVRNGYLADFRFPLVPSPFTSYINYKLLQLEKIKELTEEEQKKQRRKIKNSINVAVGCLQHHNPIWRAFIVESGNQRIKNLIDNNTIYCNTDCIVSLQRRDDISISEKIGDFKIENEGSCKIDDYSITWSDGSENRRGFKNKNKYFFDKKAGIIREIKVNN